MQSAAGAISVFAKSACDDLMVGGGLRRKGSRATSEIARRLVLVVASLGVGAGLAELSLSLSNAAAKRFSRGEHQACLDQIPDPRLGHRVPPGQGGMDAMGYRNASVPERVEVVALGDSLTFGFNARRSEAWPAVFSRVTGLSIQNLGMGGFGPVQFVEQTADALAFHPKLLVVALYLGNDLYDAYRLAYKFDAHARFRNKSPEELVDNVLAHSDAAESTPMRETLGWNDWLVRKSDLFTLLNRHGLWPGDGRTERFLRGKAWARDNPEKAVVYESAAACTVLLPAYRLQVLDLEHPCIAEGLRITEMALGEIHQAAARRGVDTVVVILPTKEAVYAPLLAAAERGPIYDRLVHAEVAVRGRLVEACAADGIPLVDLTEGLRADAAAGMRLFPPSSDGHPIALGYQRIGERLAEELSRRNLPRATSGRL